MKDAGRQLRERLVGLHHVEIVIGMNVEAHEHRVEQPAVLRCDAELGMEF